VTLSNVRAATVAVEKQSILFILSVFVALGIQHAMRMRHICSLPGSTIFFPHYLIKVEIFEEKIIEHKMCVLIFSATFV
jgi:hypothetical protein